MSKANKDGFWQTKVKPMREELFKRFPKAFAQERNSLHFKRALKIGIYEDILARAPDLDPKTVRLAIADYTTGKKYAMACKTGRCRIDLDGHYSGEVSEADADYTTKKNNLRKEYVKKVREAQTTQAA